MSATLVLTATSAVSEGGTITYTASVGSVAATSNITVLLSNGQTITISAGKTSGTLTVVVPAVTMPKSLTVPMPKTMTPAASL